MFSTSTQKRSWTFKNEDQIARVRHNANFKYIKSITNNKKELSDLLLTPEEELVIIRYYEQDLREFLKNFMPRQETLPKEVKGTVLQLFKRFYATNSVMNYHPKEMMITCIYLACKICEYMLPIDLFVKNIDGDKNLLKFIIIDQELELLARINFQIHIINPYRALDGILLDIKTRCKFRDPSQLQIHISGFLSAMWHTDVCLLYSPSQIALAAVMHACSRCKENIDDFIMNTYLIPASDQKKNLVIRVVREIRSKVMNQRPVPNFEEVAPLDYRLSQCRNPHNDPKSQTFKTRMREYMLETL